MSIEFTADQLDQLVKTTLPFYVRDQLFSQADQATPALNNFKQRKKNYPGGDQIVVTARFGRENGWDLVTSSDQDLTFYNPSPLKEARYSWEMNHLGLTFSWQEMAQAGFSLSNADSGEFARASQQDKVRIQDFLQSKFEQMDFDSRHSFAQDRIWSDGTNGFPGVPALVTDTPDTGATGGLSRSSNPLWRNRARVGSSNRISYSSSNQTLTQTLRSEMKQLRRYGSVAHKAYCGSLFLEALEIEMTAKGSYTESGFNRENIDVGVNGIALGNMLFMYEPALDDNNEENRCYIVDHNNIRLYMHSGNDMTIHEPARPHDKLAYYRSILWSGAMVATRLNSSGVYEVDTAGLPTS